MSVGDQTVADPDSGVASQAGLRIILDDHDPADRRWIAGSMARTTRCAEPHYRSVRRREIAGPIDDSASKRNTLLLTARKFERLVMHLIFELKQTQDLAPFRAALLPFPVWIFSASLRLPSAVSVGNRLNR